MSTRNTRQANTLARKGMEMAIAVPQVVAHRMTRMAIASPQLSDRDSKEFKLMVSEKSTAFTEAWQAMAVQAFMAQQTMALTMMRSMWSPTMWRHPVSGKAMAKMQNATMGAAMEVLGKGMAPVHRKAVANAKRLANTRLK